MKRLFVALLIVGMVLGMIPVGVSADNGLLEGNIVSQSMEMLTDGNYAEIIVTDNSPAITTHATTTTKTGSKAYVLRNKDGKELWRFTVHGTFSVTSGVKATCTNVTYSIKITDTAWEKESASVSKSGSQALGDATFIRKLLFITVETKSCHVVLNCDKNGNLS